MNPFTFAYNQILFRPLFNLLVGITALLPGHNIGVSIVIMTMLVRLALLPSFIHQAKSMQKNQHTMKELKKDLEKIKEKYKHDKAKEAEETMKLYREAGINPAQGCLPLLIQLPILLALYKVFFSGIGPDTYQYLYSFVSPLQDVQTMFLGIDLSLPSIVLAVLAGVGQFIQMKLMAPQAPAPQIGDDDTAQVMASMQKNMAYIFPVMTVIIAIRLPAALALYWVVSTLLGLAQQYWFKKRLNLTAGTPAM